MADPTIKDVLKALEAMRADVDRRFDGVDKRFDGVDKRFDGVDKRFDKLTAEMHKRFDDLDEELDKHASVTHRKLEADIATLKKRPPTRTARAPRRR